MAFCLVWRIRDEHNYAGTEKNSRRTRLERDRLNRPFAGRKLSGSREILRRYRLNQVGRNLQMGEGFFRSGCFRRIA